MANDVTVYKAELDARMEDIANVLATHRDLPPLAFKVGLLDQVENNPTLRECSPLSFCNAALTCATLGLSAQRTSGQFYMIPVKSRGVYHVQPYVGYRGYNTLAIHQGGSIMRGLVRDGDHFEFDLGTRQISHRFDLGGNREKKAILAGWAKVEFMAARPLLSVLTYARMQEKKTGRGDAWRNHPESMYEKMAVIELGKSMPMGGYAMASIMESMAEDAPPHPTWIDPHHGVMAGDTPAPNQVQRLVDTQVPVDKPDLGAEPFRVIWPAGPREYPTIDQYRSAVYDFYKAAEDKRDELSDFLERNVEEMTRIAEAGHADVIDGIKGFFGAQLDKLSGDGP